MCWVREYEAEERAGVRSSSRSRYQWINIQVLCNSRFSRSCGEVEVYWGPVYNGSSDLGHCEREVWTRHWPVKDKFEPQGWEGTCRKKHTVGEVPLRNHLCWSEVRMTLAFSKGKRGNHLSRAMVPKVWPTGWQKPTQNDFKISWENSCLKSAQKSWKEIAKKGIVSADLGAQCKDDRKSGLCEHGKKNGQGKENLGTVCYVRI